MMLPALRALAIMVVGVTLAKCSQYAAVEYLGPDLGFDVASLLGLGPVLILLLVLNARYPRIFRPRR